MRLLTTPVAALVGAFAISAPAWGEGPMQCRSKMVKYQRHNVVTAMRCDGKRATSYTCRPFEFDPKGPEWELRDASYTTQGWKVYPESEVRELMIVDRERWTFTREEKIRWPEGNTARLVWTGRCFARVPEGDVTVKELGAVEP
jgi:hypothetical protein